METQPIFSGLIDHWWIQGGAPLASPHPPPSNGTQSAVDPGVPMEDTDFGCGYLLVEMYAKMKELGPMGGCAGSTPKIHQCNSFIFE